MKLREEVADVCEVDREKQGYTLVWDDGTSLWAKTTEDVRLAARVRRQALGRPEPERAPAQPEQS